MRKIKQLTTELTFRCNAKCPACHRLRIDKIDLNDPKYTYTLESFKQLFYPKLLNNLEWLILNGNFGDSIMNKQFREIISYVKEHGTKINIHTNGGIHNHEYWADVGKILQKDDIINFDLDGLADTHHIYRINTKFDKVLSNAKTVIDNTQASVHWKYIVFEHNKHQVNDAKELAKTLGFNTFSSVKTSRDFARPKSGSFVHIKRTEDYKNAERKINCVWEDYSRFYYPPDFTKKFNGFYVPIEKIISYNYWNKLSKYLEGYERSFSLCKSQCGKIVSSIEKIEENLITGNQQKVDAHNQWGN